MTRRGPASADAQRLAIESGLPLDEAERRIAKWKWMVAMRRLAARRKEQEMAS